MPPLPPPLPLNTEEARTLVILAIVFPIIGTATLTARFVSRTIKRVGFGPDDYVMIPGILALYAQCIIVILSVYYGGVGHHITDLTPEHLTILFKLLVGVQFTFGSSLGLAKISLCLLLIRIFPSKQFHIAAYKVLAYCVCWILMVWSIGAGLCQPCAFNWDKTIPNGHCGNLIGAHISIAVTDIVGDLLIIALPMPAVWRLNIRTTTKVGISILFALGFLDVIAAICRIVYLLQINFAAESDVAWQAAEAYAWNVIEPNVGLIVVNGAVISPVIKYGVILIANNWTKLKFTSVLDKIWLTSSRRDGSSRVGHAQVGSADCLSPIPAMLKWRRPQDKTIFLLTKSVEL